MRRETVRDVEVVLAWQLRGVVARVLRIGGEGVVSGGRGGGGGTGRGTGGATPLPVTTPALNTIIYAYII